MTYAWEVFKVYFFTIIASYVFIYISAKNLTTKFVSLKFHNIIAV